MIKKERLFLKEECSQLIDWIETLNNFKQTHLANYHFSELDDTFPGYSKIKNWCNVNLRFESSGWLQCFKYLDGQSFPLHRDRNSAYDFAKDSSINVNVVLNDDYDGGEFYTNDVYYKNEPGMIYWYSSNQLHGVTEVKNGTRYVLLYTIREREIKRQFLF